MLRSKKTEKHEDEELEKEEFEIAAKTF